MTRWKDSRAEASIITRLTRREFLSVCGSGIAAAGVSAAGLAAACGGDHVSEPIASSGTVRGTVTDLAGKPQAVGRIYLLLASGLNQNIFADVSASGTFDLGSIPVGAYQLRFWGGTQASVPEPLANPVLINVSADAPTVVQFRIEVGAPDETVQEIYAGDYFFQQQPFGEPNAMVTVKAGVIVCWYNVGLHNHTVTGGPWGDSGTIGKAEEFMWTANQLGTFGYRCNFHNPLMQAIVRVVP
jgi:plastocyanin